MGGVLNKMKKENALQYLINLSKHTQDMIAFYLRPNKPLQKTTITRYCNRERKIKTEEYIIRLERVLKIPREYWLGDDGYTKVLTPENKKKIDEYYRNKNDEYDTLIYKEIGEHPYQKELIIRDTEIAIDELKNKITECIYNYDDNYYTDEYTFYQRVVTILEVVAEIKRIGIDNMDDCLKLLKEYQPKQPTLMTLEEYEELFGKTQLENTSE